MSDTLALPEMLSERASYGADLLSSRLGHDWVDEVNVDKLDMCEWNTCILADLYGDYHAGALSLGLTTHQQIFYGFYLDVEELGEEVVQLMYVQLTTFWKQIITSRKEIRSATHNR